MFVICRRGNDSQVAVQLLTERMAQSGGSPLNLSVSDIKGGLAEWSKCVDEDFPTY